MSKLDQKIKTDWLTALRSGDYPQSRSDLKNQNGFCCLGVLADLQKPEWVLAERSGRMVPFLNGECLAAHSSSGQLGSDFMRQVGLAHDDARVLMEKNDGGDTFEQIATFIEGNL